MSTLKSYTGHTLGACGALEASFCVEMMREGWVAPTQPRRARPALRRARLRVGAPRELDAGRSSCNNFAFGGINTSLVFRRWPDS